MNHDEFHDIYIRKTMTCIYSSWISYNWSIWGICMNCVCITALFACYSKRFSGADTIFKGCVHISVINIVRHIFFHSKKAFAREASLT
jgi:hypothetical protein